MNGEHPPMQRVSRQRRCAICGRPDWCLVSDDGSAAICARISEGGVKQCGAAGWLHILSDRPKDPTPRRRRTIRIETDKRPRDFGAFAKTCTGKAGDRKVGELAKGLGVSVDGLRRLGVGWSDEHRSWSFPMRGADDKVVGIRLRSPGGSKFAVTGGREGLFVPSGMTFAERLLVCEGPTDTAALLGLGFEVIGRPNCRGGRRLVCELVQKRKPLEVVIVADNGEPGVRGAEALAATLVVYCRAVRVIRPPDGIKDARAWVQAGATRQDILAIIEAAPVRKLNIGRSEK